VTFDSLISGLPDNPPTGQPTTLQAPTCHPLPSSCGCRIPESVFNFFKSVTYNDDLTFSVLKNLCCIVGIYVIIYVGFYGHGP